MTRTCAPISAAVVVSLGLLLARPALAASPTQVTRSAWAGSTSLPSYLQMWVYVPAKMAANPPIVVSAHSCMGSASNQAQNIPKTLAAADAQGFIVILPDNPGQNCWDVGSSKSLTHDGGGDTQGVALMVKYALKQYNGDPNRVYIFGGSSGGMMTQAMLAVYPDLFRAGSARAGVPAGCWAKSYDSTMQWSDPCAKGQVSMTAQQWGDGVRAMYPGYTGHRPRVQTFQGTSDETISYNNTGESIKEWTNVLNLSTSPTSMDSGYKAAGATYNRQFWSNACGYTVLQVWSSPGGMHSMPYEEVEILKFFGLDTVMASDPEPDCSGGGGTSGGGAGTSGGSAGAGGAHAAGGAAGHGGLSGTGGTPATGGVTGTGGLSATGGVTGTGGVSATGGTPGTGGVEGTGGVTASGGSSGGSPAGQDTSSNGCSCATGPGAGGGLPVLALVIAGLALGRRSRRRRP